MKIAVSANANDLNSMVNPVFGRCLGFVIAEIEGKKIKNHSFIENPAMSAGGGAGILAAQTVVSNGVQAVISGNIGPNAFMVLNQSKVKCFQAMGLTIQESINQFMDGKLAELNASSVGDKFGMPGMGRGFGGAGRGRRSAGRGRGFGRGQM